MVHVPYILQVYGEDEWSFGYCEEGSGVFSCPYGRNPMYTYRESIILGETDLTKSKVNQLLRELSLEWPGDCYDLLSKNCNHFCDEFCERLGVPKLPGLSHYFFKNGLEVQFSPYLNSKLVFWQFLLLICTGWVNRFANAGDTAVEIAGTTAYRVSIISTKITDTRLEMVILTIMLGSAWVVLMGQIKKIS